MIREDTPVGANALDIKTSGDDIEVFFKDRPVMMHSRRSPLVSAGSARGEYTMSHGNFRIRPGFGAMRPCTIARLESGVAGASQARISFPEAAVTLNLSVTGDTLLIEPVCADPAINRFALRLCCARDDHFYGCGEQYSRLDLTGSRVPLWTSEQGVGRGHDAITLYANWHSRSGGSWHSTYYPVPAFVASSGWYCAADAYAYAELDFRPRNIDGGDRRGGSGARAATVARAARTPSARTAIELAFCEVPKAIHVGRESSVRDAVGALARSLGTQPALPDWVFDGMLLGVQGGALRVEEKLRSALDAGVKVSALWAQDWEGKRETAFGRQLQWNWRYDRSLYPDLPAQIARLRDRGVRLLGYINSFLAIEGDLYREASRKGLCVKDRGGGDYLVVVTTFPAAMLDLTNPDTVAWIKGVIRENMIGIGLSGWMADFGEYLPTDAVLWSGEAAEIVHNRYPALWARTNREALEEAGKMGDAFFFMRAGGSGSSRYATAFWAGDQLVNFSRNDGLPSVIPAALSLGVVGAGITHSDIGGYTTLAWIKRSKEVFMRWAEHAAFSPIMRTHEGNRPDSNWQFNGDAETLAHLARMTRVYAALKPYHQALLAEYTRSGLPPMRLPLLAAPRGNPTASAGPTAYAAGDDPAARATPVDPDRRLYRLRDQYLYGDDLMIAPAVRRGARSRPVYLPEGEWVHLWSGRSYRPGRHRVAAPFGSPPVFMRAGSTFESLFRELPRVAEG